MREGETQLDQDSYSIPGHWARKLSWKEAGEEFHISWDKVRDAVGYLVNGHKYLTLMYQIDLGCTRLLWSGQENGR